MTKEATMETDNVVLKYGSHPNRDGMCAMEFAAHLAGEEWSDSPQCVDKSIAAFLRRWNDGFRDDAERTRVILPLIPKTLNTRGPLELQRRRAYMATDWAVRVSAPAWLELAGLTEEAVKARAIPEIVDEQTARGAHEALRSIRDAAWAKRQENFKKLNAADAAYAADAADAAYAAYAAAYAAADAYAAAYAAADAADAAAYAAAYADADAYAAAYADADAARYGLAKKAAEDKLRPVKESLQRSAAELVLRMCELKETEKAA